MILALCIAVIAVTTFLALVHNKRWVPQIAITGIVLLACLVPSFGPADTFQIVAVGGSGLIAVAAIVRRAEGGGSDRKPLNFALIAYLLYSTFAAAVSGSTSAAVFRVALGGLLVLVVLLATRASRASSNYFPALIATVVTVEVLLGVSEAVFGESAVWPRPDGSDRLQSRVNHLAPFLPGRVLGTLAGPIPYGTIAGVGVIASVWMLAAHRRRRYWLFLAVSSAGLLLSGTRSAAIAVAVVVLIWMVSRSSVSRPVVVALAILGGAIVLLTSDIGAIFGLTNFEDTNSFNHRSQILNSVIEILTKQTPMQVLFGNGQSASSLLTNGVVSTTTGVMVFDNQWVRELAATGLLGVALLFASVVAAMRRGNALSRMIVVFLAMMFFSFDALTWRVVAIIFVVAAAAPLGEISLTGQKSTKQSVAAA